MSDQTLDKAREVARQIGKRIMSEPGFKEQVQKDPHGTLTAAGLAEEYIPDFLRETGMTDVAGYKADTCWSGSCLILSL